MLLVAKILRKGTRFKVIRTSGVTGSDTSCQMSAQGPLRESIVAEASGSQFQPPTGAMQDPHIFALGVRSGFPHFAQGGPYMDNTW